MLRALLAALLLLIASPASAHEWIGWFEYGRTELSPRGYVVAREVAVFAEKFGYKRIIVTGHLDTAEAIEFSDELSRRRAQAIATELVQLGVAAEMIEIRGKRAEQLARATAKNVSEPLNRRVVVDVR